MAKIQDIHLSDIELLQLFEFYWGQQNYSQALSLLESNPQLDTKVTKAEIFNALQGYLIELQNKQDPTFKSDKIKVSFLPPADLRNGEIYFQVN